MTYTLVRLITYQLIRTGVEQMIEADKRAEERAGWQEIRALREWISSGGDLGVMYVRGRM